MGEQMIKPVVLLVGQSGSGKSSTFRNLDPAKTVILNTERRPMPFRSFGKFKNINISKYKDFVKVLKELKENTDYEFVIVDSMTSLLEIMDKYCRTVYSGYNIFSEYNSMTYDVLQDIKELPQQVFVTGIPEYLDIGDGVQKSYLKTIGKTWKYSLEKEFSIVLHTVMVDDDEGNIVEYQLDTKPSKHTSAKSPDGMFEERYISNDAVEVVKAIDAYYNGET